MSTFEMLMVMFKGSPMISIEDAAQFWSMEPNTLVAKIDTGAVRLPYIRLADSQKAQRMFMTIDLAAYIDQRHAEALSKFGEKWSEDAKDAEDAEDAEDA
ncbi:MAG: pyocin activator PrtN family protein [Paracoccaceae bacterium]